VQLELSEWMDHVFGGPQYPSVERLIELEDYCNADIPTLQRLTEVFENAGTMLDRFPDDSLAQAFWDLGNGPLAAVENPSIEWPLRERFIRSFETLFREVFAVRCEPVLGHLSKGSALNIACYMWWDFDCWRSSPDPIPNNPLDTALLALMRTILAIDHVACWESALHGLGHRHRDHGPEVEEIIDEFLGRESNLSPELRQYAANARTGYVL
jgi:hypothetical protein